MTHTTATTAPTRRPLGPLPLALRLDAGVTGVNGLAYLAAAPLLSGLLGVPAGTLRGLGAFLAVFAAGVALVAARTPVSRGATEVVVGANALWAAGSVAAVAAGRFDLTTAGTVWVLLQAAVVAGFAALQLTALRTH
ncbi:hypothetical protein SAMN05660690_4221 [Geodermatophilus telluris]|uniref:Integral membrane protein n=1 Tax=Geodermatophilus telluris TaxID=1190417 RepID=A0A1G6UGB7_9ACTN|nr:hypothetical protein [Geodermatophilus telluris]SDD40450.1 hypothetical protein SAMN05660690_4221 [Geodermatophilus telluris]